MVNTCFLIFVCGILGVLPSAACYDPRNICARACQMNRAKAKTPILMQQIYDINYSSHFRSLTALFFSGSIAALKVAH